MQMKSRENKIVSDSGNILFLDSFSHLHNILLESVYFSPLCTGSVYTGIIALNSTRDRITNRIALKEIKKKITGILLASHPGVQQSRS